MDSKHLTRDYLLGLITKTTFTKRGTTTICELHVKDMPFPIKGESHCMYRSQYVQSVGERIAYENALTELRQYEQYAQIKRTLQNC